MTSNHQRHPIAPGRVDGPTVLCGSVGLLVAVAMFWVGMLGKGDQRILDLLDQPVFRGGVPDILSTPILISLTVSFCFGLAFAVLDSPGNWRRCVLGVTVLVIAAALVPALAVWNIYFPPMMTLVGVFWTWFSAMMYVSHHQMPCDVPIKTPEVSITKTVDPAQPILKKKAVKKNARKSPKKKAKKRKRNHDLDKYKPKD